VARRRHPLTSPGPGHTGVCRRVRPWSRTTTEASGHRRRLPLGNPPRLAPTRPTRITRSANVESTARSSREENLPTQGSPPFPQARLPAPHVGPRRSGHHQGSPAQGPPAALRLIVLAGSIDRISGRAAFRRFQSSSQRARSGPLKVVYVPGDDLVGPAVAFAISRKVGSAVVRNRIRRQLRESARDLSIKGELPIGRYLVIVSPGADGSPMTTLRGHLAQAVASLPGIPATTGGAHDV
jgi:ribonuclease P protein component